MTTDARADDLLAAAMQALGESAALGNGVAASVLGMARSLLADDECGGIDDREALAEVRQIQAAGKPRSAVMIVAAKRATVEGLSAHSIARRLRYKMKKNGN